MHALFLGHSESTHTWQWVDAIRSLGWRVDIATVHRATGAGNSTVPIHNLESAQLSLGGRYLSSLPRLKRLLRRIKPTVLHSHYASGYGALGLLSGFHPHIVSAWGSDITEFPHRSLMYRAIVRRTLEKADLICATSGFLSDRVRALTTTEVVHTPFGVDLSQFRLGDYAPRKAIRIGMVKALTPGSGYQVLLKALSYLVSRHLIEVRLAGPGDHEKVRGEVAALGLTKVVSVHPAIDHKELPNFLAALDIFVCPSIHQEAFGVAVLEAQSAGLPTVASRIGGLPEVIADEALLVSPGDARALAGRIESLVKDSSVRRRAGLIARQFVESKYSKESTAATMQRVYAEKLHWP